jgi:hypothetical protein
VTAPHLPREYLPQAAARWNVSSMVTLTSITWRNAMNSIIYIVGLVVVVGAVLAFLGFR